MLASNRTLRSGVGITDMRTVLVALLLLASSSAQATIVTWTSNGLYAGTTDDPSIYNLPLEEQRTLGEFSITFDTDRVDTRPDPQRGTFENPVLSASIRFLSFDLTIEPTASVGRVLNDYFVFDLYLDGVGFDVPGPAIQNGIQYTLNYDLLSALVAPSNAITTDSRLPETIDYARFTTPDETGVSLFGITARTFVDGIEVASSNLPFYVTSFQATRVEPVPEPATLSLLVVALLLSGTLQQRGRGTQALR